MIRSAGLLIIQDNKILLAHPTDSPWNGSFTIPKGKVEKKESPLDAAIRETKEEIGIKVKLDDIIKTPHTITYTNPKGKVYKEVIYFLCYPKIHFISEDFKLQKDEVDWAGFMTLELAESKIFWRFEEMLNYIR